MADWTSLKNRLGQKTPVVDEEIPSLGDYNNVAPPSPTPTELEEYYKKNPPSDGTVPSEDDDMKPHRQLNFDTSQSQPNKIQQFLSALAQRAQSNLQNNDSLIGQVANQSVDKIKMMNPNQFGPSQPPGASPEELALSGRIGQGVAGAIAPSKIPLSANISSGIAPGISTGSPMWKNMLETQIKNRQADSVKRAAFQMIKQKLGRY